MIWPFFIVLIWLFAAERGSYLRGILSLSDRRYSFIRDKPIRIYAANLNVASISSHGTKK
jgi:hypothetical protein